MFSMTRGGPFVIKGDQDKGQTCSLDFKLFLHTDSTMVCYTMCLTYEQDPLIVRSRTQNGRSSTNLDIELYLLSTLKLRNRYTYIYYTSYPVRVTLTFTGSILIFGSKYVRSRSNLEF